MSDDFLETSQRLLEAEQTLQTDLTVASLAMLSISMICYGNDELAKKYMSMCIQMGEGMNLLGIERHKIEQFDRFTASEAAMLSHAAWGSFNVST